MTTFTFAATGSMALPLVRELVVFCEPAQSAHTADGFAFFRTDGERGRLPSERDRQRACSIEMAQEPAVPMAELDAVLAPGKRDLVSAIPDARGRRRETRPGVEVATRFRGDQGETQ